MEGNFLDFYMSQKMEEAADAAAAVDDDVGFKIGQVEEANKKTKPEQKAPVQQLKQQTAQKQPQAPVGIGDDEELKQVVRPQQKKPAVRQKQQVVSTQQVQLKKQKITLLDDNLDEPEVSMSDLINQDFNKQSQQSENKPAQVKPMQSKKPVENVQPTKHHMRANTSSTDGPLFGEELDELFRHSDTPTHLYDEWVKMYQQSYVTKKKGYIVERCKKGLFRLTEDNKLEILPEYDMYGKDTKSIISDLTKPGRTMFNKSIE